MEKLIDKILNQIEETKEDIKKSLNSFISELYFVSEDENNLIELIIKTTKK